MKGKTRKLEKIKAYDIENNTNSRKMALNYLRKKTAVS